MKLIKTKSIALFLLLILLINIFLVVMISAPDLNPEDLQKKVNGYVSPGKVVVNGASANVEGSIMTTGTGVIIDLKDLRYLSAGTTVTIAEDGYLIFNKDRSNEAMIVSGEVKRNSDGSFNIKNANLKIKGNYFSSQKDASITLKVSSDKVGIKSDSEIVEKDKDGNIVSKFKGEVSFYDGYRVVAGGTNYQAYDVNGKESYKLLLSKSVSISSDPNFKPADGNSAYIIAYIQNGQNKMIIGADFGSESSRIDLFQKFDIDATSVKFGEKGELVVKVIDGGSYKITSGNVGGDSKVVPGEITGKFVVTDKNGKSSLITLDSKGNVNLDGEYTGKIIDKTNPSSATASIIDSAIGNEKAPEEPAYTYSTDNPIKISNMKMSQVNSKYSSFFDSNGNPVTGIEVYGNPNNLLKSFEGNVEVQFSASWCGPCQTQKNSRIGESGSLRSDVRQTYVYVDVDKQPNLARSLGYSGGSIPQFRKF